MHTLKIHPRTQCQLGSALNGFIQRATLNPLRQQMVRFPADDHPRAERADDTPVHTLTDLQHTHKRRHQRSRRHTLPGPQRSKLTNDVT